MPLPYAQNKKHILKWRETHPEGHKKNNNNCVRRYRAWKSVKFEFLSILL